MTSIACQATCLLVVCFELLPPTELWALHEGVQRPPKRYAAPGNRSGLRAFRGDRRLGNRTHYRFKRPPLSANTTLLTTIMPPLDDGEENQVLLWLPYVIFTIVLLSLILMSFIRFHFQRGDQNRRRREELEDKPVMNGVKPPVESTAVLGSDSGWDRYPTIAKTIPDHLSLFLQFSQTEEDDTPRKSALKKSESGQFYEAKKISSDEPSICSGSRFKRSCRSKMPALQEPSVAFADKRCSRMMAQLVPKSKNVAFTFNANGSMVDVRCTEEERSNTFRIHEKSDINQNNLEYQSGVDHKSASLSSKGSKWRKMENHLTQSLERHYFKSDSLPRPNHYSPNHPLNNVHSVDSSNYRYFNKELVNSPNLNQYHTPPLQLSPDKSPYICSSTTSVKMVDAATSPGLVHRSSKHSHHSPYHNLHPPLDDLSSPGEG